MPLCSGMPLLALDLRLFLLRVIAIYLIVRRLFFSAAGVRPPSLPPSRHEICHTPRLLCYIPRGREQMARLSTHVVRQSGTEGTEIKGVMKEKERQEKKQERNIHLEMRKVSKDSIKKHTYKTEKQRLNRKLTRKKSKLSSDLRRTQATGQAGPLF